ncbi:MAG TPA: DUF4190 domain-containing protein [Pyrinomonadaceae bacterium]|jgi:hypothetical protein|nr:DUF4190 domain-containing protein [Pyrinomonadaceae bacterium]
MKRCPRCNQTYTDDDLNFCLNDGELLTSFNDAPPTVFMDPPRVTDQTGWQSAPPPAPWQSPQNMQSTPFGTPAFVQSRDQTLPTIALVLGILSVLMICCYGGLWLGLPAAVVGFLGMKNADSDPTRYGGRGMAIGGLVLGIVSFLAFLGWMVVLIFGSLAH